MDESQIRRLTTLMGTALKIKEITGKTVYDEPKLFNLLIDRIEKQPILFDYTYETILNNIYEKVPIFDQLEDYRRLLVLNSLEEEFNNPQQWTKISRF